MTFVHLRGPLKCSSALTCLYPHTCHSGYSPSHVSHSLLYACQCHALAAKLSCKCEQSVVAHHNFGKRKLVSASKLYSHKPVIDNSENVAACALVR